MSAPATGTRPFDVPSLPPMAAHRDRRVEADERVARLREDGFASGYQAGLDAAQRDIELEIADHRFAAERLAAAGRAFEVAADDLRRRDAVALAELEQAAISIAIELAGEIVGRELRSTPEPVVDALARAATFVPERGRPMVRAHPDDIPVVRATLTADALTWRGDVEVVPDPQIERGGCVVDVGACRIDAQVGPALERLRAALH